MLYDFFFFFFYISLYKYVLTFDLKRKKHTTDMQKKIHILTSKIDEVIHQIDTAKYYIKTGYKKQYISHKISYKNINVP